MSWRLGKSMRLRLQTGLQNLSNDEEISRAWENIRVSKPQLKRV